MFLISTLSPIPRFSRIASRDAAGYSTSSLPASLAVKMKRSRPSENAGLRLRAIHQASRAKAPSVVGSRGF
jgi:hypothetical protein